MSLLGFPIFGGYFPGFGPWGPIAQWLPPEQAAVPDTEKVEPNEPIDRSMFSPIGIRGWLPGFDNAPPPGPYIWWQMRRYP